MSGGVYTCNKNSEHRHVRYSSEPSGRIACYKCDGWMMLEEIPETKPYKKPNIIWLGVGTVIWFFLKPVSEWLDKHDRSDDDD